MARSIIQTDGSIVYRTTLLLQGRAEAFAAMISANSRFTDVQTRRSERAKTDRAFFVTFQPSNEVRKDFLFSQQVDARKERGEAGEFIFWPDADQLTAAGDPMFWWCLSVSSMEVYEVSIGNCSCPDYLYRVAPAGLGCCKHMAAWSSQKAAGVLGKTDKVTPQASEPVSSSDAERTARRARLAESFNSDF